MSILFDLDGTLLDTAPDFITALQALRQEMGLPLLSEAAFPSIRLAVTHGLSAIIEAGFAVSGGTEMHKKLCAGFLSLYYQNLGKHAIPYPGIEPLLETLEKRDIPWGIVTNKETNLTSPLLERLGLKNRAACVICGDTTPNPKPHPDPLLAAARQINLPPSQCVYIGDAERDIIAGNAAGMTTIGALFGYIENVAEAKKWGADHYVHHVDEILPWYEAWQRLPQ